MIKESNLIGLPILNINYESLNYSVKDVIYCIENFTVLGLCLQDLLSEKNTKVILYTRIKSITERGVIIYAIEDIANIEEVPKIKNTLENYKPVIGYEIYLNKDELIGVVKDTLLQIKSGKILGFIMSEGLFDDLVNGYSFLPLVEGIDFSECKILLKEQEQLKILPQQGGLKKMLGIDKEK